MLDARIVRAGDVYRYDPKVAGYSTTYWLTVDGTPAIASDILRLSEATVQSVVASTFGTLEMRLKVPAAPASGDDKTWGIASSLQGDESKYVFVIADDVFSVAAYDEAGNLIGEKEITWLSDWTDADIRYSIRRTERDIYFIIGKKFGVSGSTDMVVSFKNCDNLSRLPMSHYVSNADTDDLDLSLVTIYGV